MGLSAEFVRGAGCGARFFFTEFFLLYFKMKWPRRDALGYATSDKKRLFSSIRSSAYSQG
jgi:hypothetical protein